MPASAMSTAAVDALIDRPFPRAEPPLYTMPDVDRIMRLLSVNVTPSPYVANMKRREGGKRAEEKMEGRSSVVEEVKERDSENARSGEMGAPVEGIMDFDVDDLSTTMDPSYLDRWLRSASTLSTRTVFYDAADDFTSTPGSPLASASTEMNSWSSRVALFEEIEQRKQAEESLFQIKKQWEKMCARFSEVDLSFPPIRDGQSSSQEEKEDGTAQVCRDVVIGRCVSEAVGRCLGRADAEVDAEEVIASKDREIARLNARLRYYQAVNREMTQMHMEILERSLKKKELRRQRWAFGSVGLLVTIGASLFAYSCLPDGGSSIFNWKAFRFILISSSHSQHYSGVFAPINV